MFSDRIRVFNKYVTNRVLRGFAHLSHGPFAIIHHVGRRSGKPYETVIMVWPTGEGFVIALTYGPKVDWYRNILAAGGSTVFWHRKVYAVGKPEPINARTALPVFPTPFRQILRRIGLQDFVRVKFIEPPGSNQSLAGCWNELGRQHEQDECIDSPEERANPVTHHALANDPR